MIAKFQTETKIIEVSKVDSGVSFFIYEFGEEQVGQEITLPIKDTHELISYLQKITDYSRPSFFAQN